MKRTHSRLLPAGSLVGTGTAAIALGAAIVRGRRIERQTIGTERFTREAVDRLHADKVARIVAQLRAHPGDRPLSLRKKAAPHQVPKGGDLRRRDDKIDISELTQIL